MISSARRKELLQFQSRNIEFLAEEFRREGFDTRFVYDDHGFVREVLVCPTASEPNFVLVGESINEAWGAISAFKRNDKTTAAQFCDRLYATTAGGKAVQP